MDDDETGQEHSALGICRCLRMLAEEAAALDLPESARILRDAIRICARESGLDRTAMGIPALLN